MSKVIQLHSTLQNSFLQACEETDPLKALLLYTHAIDEHDPDPEVIFHIGFCYMDLHAWDLAYVAFVCARTLASPNAVEFQADISLAIEKCNKMRREENFLERLTPEQES